MADEKQVGQSSQAMSEATKAQLLKKIYAENIHILTFVLKKFRFSIQDEEDLLQNIFLRFYQVIDRIDLAGARSYLVVITKNAAIDHYRSKKRKREIYDLQDTLHMSDTNAEESALQLNRYRAVNDFMEKIRGEPGADVFLMFYDQEASLKDIAAQKREPVGTITSRLCRLRNKYKARLQLSLERTESYG